MKEIFGLFIFKIRIGIPFLILVVNLFFLAGCFTSSSSDVFVKERSYWNDPNSDWYKLKYTVATEKDAMRIIKQLDARAPEYDPDEKSVTVFLTPEEAQSYADQGFEMEEHAAYNPFHTRSDTGNVRGIPGFACYRKVAETFSDAQKLSADHPDLVIWKSAGNSYLKSINQGGENIWVLVVTNKSITIPKPALYITASVHAREYVTAETALRFAEYLVNNYGVDADVTWLIDYQEIHIMPLVNPDGRKKADGTTGSDLWRKNAHIHNNNNCTSGQYGADLNRNFSYMWNTSGTSSNVCDEVYPGKSAYSEPETQAVKNYYQALFNDYNTSPTTPASLDAQGIHIDMHSYGKLLIWPWGYGNALAPNHTQLQTLGRKLAFFNDYSPEKSSTMYSAAGDTNDEIYSNRGIPSFCFEMGTAFFQSCSSFESTIFPANLKALIYAAKNCRAPYRLALGPEVLNVTLNSNVLTAVVDDTRFKQSNGTEASQTIVAAEYYIDKPYWSNGVPISMTAADGSFNSKTENVTATIATANVSSGKHIIFVRGKDADGNWGPSSAGFLTINNDPLVANFSSTETAAVTMEFIDTSTPVNAVASRIWNFGDGTTSTVKNPVHVYQDPLRRSYNVTLTVTDTSGVSASISKHVDLIR